MVLCLLWKTPLLIGNVINWNDVCYSLLLLTLQACSHETASLFSVYAALSVRLLPLKMRFIWRVWHICCHSKKSFVSKLLGILGTLIFNRGLYYVFFFMSWLFLWCWQRFIDVFVVYIPESILFKSCFWC